MQPRLPADEPGPSFDAAAILAGDERAFHVLFDALYGPLLAFARSLLADAGNAEDLVQEAFVRLWDRREHIEPGTPLHAYLYRTVRNLAFNLRRDHANRRRLLADPVAHDSVAPAAVPQPDAQFAGNETYQRLAASVAELPPRQRQALELSRFHGLSHDEVAAAMGCSPRTVNNHIVAALSTLRRRLAEASSLVAAVAAWLI
ncbi:MAG TPA: RNA polymerase sigma-70 factor [Gemmatimonas sp.]|nr:RNA polymerase sigma-70 factor [Gemmatimonas sp.]